MLLEIYTGLTLIILKVKDQGVVLGGFNDIFELGIERNFLGDQGIDLNFLFRLRLRAAGVLLTAGSEAALASVACSHSF